MLRPARCLICLHTGGFLRLQAKSATLQNPFFMKYRSALMAILAVIATLGANPVTISAKSDTEQICVSVGRLLEEGHYTHQPLNDEMSRKFLRTYLELLDFSHLFFTQQDVDALNAKYGTSIDDDVLLGNLKPAYEIYDLYMKRVDERVAKIKELLKQPMDFKNDATIDLSRQKAPWPKDEAEADQIWRGRIANELLQEQLSEHPDRARAAAGRAPLRSPRAQRPRGRQGRAGEAFPRCARADLRPALGISEQGRPEELQHQHGPLAGRHRRDAPDRRRLCQNRKPRPGRAGANRWPIKGGRSHHRGRVRAQAEFVDCRDMRLDKVVEMIRGKKGTHVRLLAIPADAPDPSKRKSVELVRDEIKLKDQEARADIIIKKDENGKPVKLGWITLPSFYADMDKHQKSTTRDVLALLKRLKKGKYRRAGGRSAA